MGQAIITGGGPAGLYNVTLVKEPGKSVARQIAITKRLNELGSLAPGNLPGLITAASEAIDAAIVALTAAQGVLDRSISFIHETIPSLTAVPRWYNTGNGKCTKVTPGPLCDIGTYSLQFGEFIPGDPYKDPPVPNSEGWLVSRPIGSFLPNAKIGTYSSSEISFITAQGSIPFASGDAFDIEVTEVTQKPVTPVTKATQDVLTAQSNLTKKRGELSALQGELASLLKEQAQLTAAMAVEAKTGIWCTDLTENLAVGAKVGTMEMNGVDDEIILAPGGRVDKSIGLLQHVGVASPAGVFCNKARLPAWQKWKPTHRVGTITAITYETDKCDVGIEAQYSEEQGLPINQTGDAYKATKAAMQGWIDFAALNSAFPLVTNTLDTKVPNTAQLTADLTSVNSDVNNRYKYQTDIEQYGKLDNWTLMQEGGSGDCEDFALTKAKKLLDMGYPASALHIEVGTTLTGTGHAWLVVQTDKGDFALDNNYKTVMPNGATPYTARQRQTGMNWSREGVKLKDVPVEYMDGMNSGPFLVGDNVVVQFAGQAWTAPKVVGFERSPRGTDYLMVNDCQVDLIPGGRKLKLWQTTLGTASYKKEDPLTYMFSPPDSGQNLGNAYYSYKKNAYIFAIVFDAGGHWEPRLRSISAVTGNIIAEVSLPIAPILAPSFGYSVLPDGSERFAYLMGVYVCLYDENLQYVSRYLPYVDGNLIFMGQDGSLITMKDIQSSELLSELICYGITKSKKGIFLYREWTITQVNVPCGEWDDSGPFPPYYWRPATSVHEQTHISKCELRLYDLDGRNYIKIGDLDIGKKHDFWQTTAPGAGYPDIIYGAQEVVSDATTNVVSIASVEKHIVALSSGNGNYHNAFDGLYRTVGWTPEITVPSSLKVFKESGGLAYEIPRTMTTALTELGGYTFPMGNVTWQRRNRS